MVAIPLLLAAGKLAKGAWDASKHPRGPDGRFISAGKVSFRVSPRSATIMYGHTIPVVPGKVNVYAGALLRVERARGHETAIEKKLKAQGQKIAARLPAKVVSATSKGGFESSRGTTFRIQRPKVKQPQVRVQHKVRTQQTRRAPITNGEPGIRQVRAPNRKPRTRSLPKSQAPAPKKAVSSAKGKKVKK